MLVRRHFLECVKNLKLMRFLFLIYCIQDTYDPDHNRGIIDELFTYRRNSKHQSNHNGIKLTDDHIEMIERNLVFAGNLETLQGSGGGHARIMGDIMMGVETQLRSTDKGSYVAKLKIYLS